MNKRFTALLDAPQSPLSQNSESPINKKASYYNKNPLKHASTAAKELNSSRRAESVGPNFVPITREPVPTF